MGFDVLVGSWWPLFEATIGLREKSVKTSKPSLPAKGPRVGLRGRGTKTSKPSLPAREPRFRLREKGTKTSKPSLGELPGPPWGRSTFGVGLREIDTKMSKPNLFAKAPRVGLRGISRKNSKILAEKKVNDSSLKAIIFGPFLANRGVPPTFFRFESGLRGFASGGEGGPWQGGWASRKRRQNIEAQPPR